MKPKREQGENVCMKTGLEQGWQTQGMCTAIFPPPELANTDREQVTVLGELWGRTQKPLASYYQVVGVVRPSKTSPFLV